MFKREGREWANRREFPTTTTAGATAADPVTAGYFPHTYWVFFPGFGIDFCPDVERALRPVTRESGQSFCVAPSPVALDAHEIAAAVRARVTAGRAQWADPQAPITLYLYGISMGGMIAYDVARVLDGSDGIAVKAVVFDSSPAGPESVRGVAQVAVRGGAAVQRSPDLPWGIPNPLMGGPLSRFPGHLAEARGADAQARRAPTLDAARFAWYKANRVVSASAVNQLDYIAGFASAGDAALRGPFYAYLGAADPEADRTVDVTAAAAAYRRRIDPSPLDVRAIRGGTHASANTATAAYTEALRGVVHDAHLLTRRDVDWLRENVLEWSG